MDFTAARNATTQRGLRTSRPSEILGSHLNKLCYRAVTARLQPSTTAPDPVLWILTGGSEHGVVAVGGMQNRSSSPCDNGQWYIYDMGSQIDQLGFVYLEEEFDNSDPLIPVLYNHDLAVNFEGSL